MSAKELSVQDSNKGDIQNQAIDDVIDLPDFFSDHEGKLRRGIPIIINDDNGDTYIANLDLKNNVVFQQIPYKRTNKKQIDGRKKQA